MKSQAHTSDFTIDTAYPGGNVIVESIDGDVVRLRQDLRHTSTWWFYWNFVACHAAGRTLRFEFAGEDAFNARGPCASLDGEIWRWLGRDCLRDNGFAFDFLPGMDRVQFAFGIPYVQANLKAFLKSRRTIRALPLVKTEQGRSAQKLHLRSRKGSQVVVLSARTHACEAIASFTLEGILDFWLMDQSPAGDYLRQEVDLLVFPIVDWDGVENGAQGKFRAPHDHNRDYIDEPLYATTRAIKTAIQREAKRIVMGIDLHCPGIRGNYNEYVYLVGPPAPWDEHVRAFNQWLDTTGTGPVRCLSSNYLPDGKAWNVGLTDTLVGDICKLPTALFGATMEVPYGVSGGVTMNPQAARDLGFDIGRAISLYLLSRSTSATPMASTATSSPGGRSDGVL